MDEVERKEYIATRLEEYAEQMRDGNIRPIENFQISWTRRDPIGEEELHQTTFDVNINFTLERCSG